MVRRVGGFEDLCVGHVAQREVVRRVGGLEETKGVTVWRQFVGRRVGGLYACVVLV